MIVDPKLEKMFHNCHERKQRIDKSMRRLRAIMFCPPALAAIIAFLNYAMKILSGTMLMFLNGKQDASIMVGPVTFFISIVMAVFAACETLLEMEKLINISHFFYPASGIALLAVFIMLPAEQSSICALLIFYSLVASILNIFFRKLHEENEMLKPLKGYPHFNILLMNEKDLKEMEETPTNTEEMSPDERLMYERDHNM